MAKHLDRVPEFESFVRCYLEFVALKRKIKKGARAYIHSSLTDKTVARHLRAMFKHTQFKDMPTPSQVRDQRRAVVERWLTPPPVEVVPVTVVERPRMIAPPMPLVERLEKIERENAELKQANAELIQYADRVNPGWREWHDRKKP
jgi:hypothetical protein